MTDQDRAPWVAALQRQNAEFLEADTRRELKAYERAKTIARMHRAGVTVRTIADALGVSPQRVRQILATTDLIHDDNTGEST